LACDVSVALLPASTFVLASELFDCAPTVQIPARNKTGMRCCVFINVSIQARSS
jgi:hypothetical protein